MSEAADRPDPAPAEPADAIEAPGAAGSALRPARSFKPKCRITGSCVGKNNFTVNILA